MHWIHLIGGALLAIIGSALLAACTTWKPLVLPSGQQGFAVDCSGSNLTWAHCYQKASRACRHGYTVVEKIDNHGGHAEVGDLFGLMGGSVVDRGLLIECRHGAMESSVAPAGPGAPAEAFPAHDGAAPRAAR